jgi:hypothetical protein
MSHKRDRRCSPHRKEIRRAFRDAFTIRNLPTVTSTLLLSTAFAVISKKLWSNCQATEHEITWAVGGQMATNVFILHVTCPISGIGAAAHIANRFGELMHSRFETYPRLRRRCCCTLHLLSSPSCGPSDCAQLHVVDGRKKTENGPLPCLMSHWLDPRCSPYRKEIWGSFVDALMVRNLLKRASNLLLFSVFVVISKLWSKRQATEHRITWIGTGKK